MNTNIHRLKRWSFKELAGAWLMSDALDYERELQEIQAEKDA